MFFWYCLRFASGFDPMKRYNLVLSSDFFSLSRNVLCTGNLSIVLDIGVICRTVTFGCNTSRYSGLINQDTFVHPMILSQSEYKELLYIAQNAATHLGFLLRLSAKFEKRPPHKRTDLQRKWW